jgi:hypothetical protein
VDDFYRVIAIAGAGLVVVSALWTLVRLQGERPFSWLGTLIAGAGAAISLVIYLLIVDIELKDEATWGLLAGGALAGALVGTRIPLYRRGDIVLSRWAGWHLALPPAAIAGFQIMGVRESVDGIILSLAALHAATGVAVAACAFLLIRRLGARPAAAPAGGQPVPAAAEGQCAGCGSPIQPNWRYCMRCGAPL